MTTIKLAVIEDGLEVTMTVDDTAMSMTVERHTVENLVEFMRQYLETPEKPRLRLVRQV